MLLPNTDKPNGALSLACRRAMPLAPALVFSFSFFALYLFGWSLGSALRARAISEIKALFSPRKYLDFDIVALSLLFNE